MKFKVIQLTETDWMQSYDHHYVIITDNKKRKFTCQILNL